MGGGGPTAAAVASISELVAVTAAPIPAVAAVPAAAISPAVGRRRDGKVIRNEIL